jgi:hypothetical protein
LYRFTASNLALVEHLNFSRADQLIGGLGVFDALALKPIWKFGNLVPIAHVPWDLNVVNGFNLREYLRVARASNQSRHDQGEPCKCRPLNKGF